MGEKLQAQLHILTSPITELEFYHKSVFQDFFSDDNNEVNKYIEVQLTQTVRSLTNYPNVDEIRQLINFYFLNKKHDYSLADVPPKMREYQFYFRYFTELSTVFLTHRNGEIALKYWGSESDSDVFGNISGLDKVAIWNSLNRFMSTDLLVCLYLLKNGLVADKDVEAYHSHVALADTELMKVLNQGVSETHMHQSAARHFNLNWAALMSRPDKDTSHPNSDVDSLTGVNENLRNYVIRMASVRLLLALFLKNKKEHEQFYYFLKRCFPDEYSPIPFVKIIELIHKVFAGERVNANDEEEWQSLFDHIEYQFDLKFNVKEELRPKWKKELAKHDILSAVFQLYDKDIPLENFFLLRCLKYSVEMKTDHLFSQLFWQYIRVKNGRFKLEVQRNELKGLDYFMRFFERGTTYLSEDMHLQWGLTLNTLLKNSYLHKIEMRIANWSERSQGINVLKEQLKKKLLPFFECYEQILNEFQTSKRRTEKPEFGLILHLIKQEDVDCDNGERTCYAYTIGSENIQWAQLDLQNKYELEARAWSEVREEIPHMSKFLVGFDAANSEFKAPPAIFAPIFREIRDSKTTKLFDESDERIINLGLTYHVGEDFRHVMTGLRHIHEVIERFQFRAGDRLGHAIALGIDVKKWGHRQRVAYMPRIEYLDNLLWLWGFCKEYSDIHINLHRLEQLIYAQSVKIYEDNTTVRIESLYKAYVKKFNWIRDEIKDAVQCQCRRSAGAYQWDIQSLYLANHCPTFLNRMNETIQVTLNDEDMDIAEQVQQKLQELVACHGIVVETNPTSNAAIGEIDDVFDHYIFSLSDVATKKRNIKVTVNTDDPVTFNTSINNEFAYIYYGLLNRGIEREVALEWIDKIRLNGMQASFIPTRQSFRELLQEVTAVRKALQEEVLPYTVKEQSDTPKFRLQGRLRR